MLARHYDKKGGIIMYRDFEKPADMADDTILSADGVNPIYKDDENPQAQNGYQDGMDIIFPGVIPPAYFPGFPGGPSIG